jgi:hypothetical protein
MAVSLISLMRSFVTFGWLLSPAIIRFHLPSTMNDNNSAWRQWQAYVESGKLADMRGALHAQKRRAGETIIRRWRQGTLIPAFREWRHVAHQNRQHRRLVLERTCNRLANSTIWRAWRAWNTFVEEEKVASQRRSFAAEKRALQQDMAHGKQVARLAIIKRWRLSSLSPIFQSWRTWSRQSRAHKHEVLSRTLARLESSSLWRAWRAWRSYAHQSQVDELHNRLHNQLEAANRGRIKAMIMRWSVQSLAPKFHAWREWAHHQHQRKHIVLARMLRRMENSHIWRAWRQWHAYIEHSKVLAIRHSMKHHSQAAVDTIVRRWRLGSMQPVFVSWRSYAHRQRQHRRDLLSRMLIRLQSSHIWRAWRTWKMFIEDDKIRQLRNGLETEKKKRITLMIKRWHNQTLIPCFTEWRRYARATKSHKTQLLSRTFLRLENSQLWRAWRTWLHYVEDAKVASFKAENDRLRGDVARQKAISSSSIIRRWRMGSMQPAFHAWRTYVQQHRGHKNIIMERTLSRMSSSHIWRAWRTWKHYVSSSDKYEARVSTLALQKQVNHLRQSVMVRTLTRLIASKQWSAWHTWCEFVIHERVSTMKTMLNREKAERGRAVISRWRTRTLVPVFLQWRDQVRDQRQRKKGLLGRILNRMMSSKAWSAWRTWRRYVEDGKVLQLRSSLAMHKNQHGAALIRRWRHRSMVPAFQSWRHYAYERRQYKRQLLGRTLIRLEQNNQWRAWRQWKAFTDNSKVHALHQRSVDQRKTTQIALIKRWRMMSLVPAFEQWRHFAAERRRYKRMLLDRSIKRMGHGKVWCAWRQWRDYVDHDRVASMKRRIAHERRGRVAGIIAQWHTKSVVPVFIQWRTYVRLHRRRRHQVLDQTMKRLSQSQLWRTWRQWRAYTSHQETESLRQSLNQQKHRTALASISLWRNASLHTSFIQWRRTVERRTRRQRLLARITDRYVRQQLSNSLHEWRVSVLRCQLALSSLSLRFARVRHDRSSLLSQAFHSWHTKMLAARLDHALTTAEASASRERSLSSQLDLYTRELRELKARIAADEAQVADLTQRNSLLRSDVESKQRRQHTQDQLSRQKNQARAGFFRANILLSRTFRRLLEHAQSQKRKRQALSRSLMMSICNSKRQAFHQWRLVSEWERSHDIENALASSRAQVESLLSRASSLENQLSSTTTSSSREASLTRDLELLNKKIDLLVAEVKERGHHIQFLIEENAKLSSLYQVWYLVVFVLLSH